MLSVFSLICRNLFGEMNHSESHQFNYYSEKGPPIQYTVLWDSRSWGQDSAGHVE